MNVILDNNYDINNVKILEPKKNFIINYGYFYKFIYETKYIVINNLIFNMKLTNTTMTKLSNNKYKITYENNTNNTFEIKKICEIEKSILNKLNTSKSLNCKVKTDINNLFINNYIKIYSNNEINTSKNNIDLLVKMSGIWKSEKDIGLTFRFLL
jgi:hypothetical protein